MSGAAVIRLRYRIEREAFVLDVDTDIPMHGITGVFGVSGAGKTTLLRCMAGLETSKDATLVVAGDTWEDSDAGLSRPVHRRNVGYVFQEPRLFEHLSVRGNIEYGARRREHGRNPTFDQVESFNYPAAHRLSAVLLVVAFVALLALFIVNRRCRR